VERKYDGFDFLFGGPGVEAVAGCKEILLQSTQALLVSIKRNVHIECLDVDIG
jgi:hypothetical protein